MVNSNNNQPMLVNGLSAFGDDNSNARASPILVDGDLDIVDIEGEVPIVVVVR